ncbi:MAG: AraC family transcriptional regulator [Gammaproteobacteria bacterium]|nr:AraC family transcriptional regulator [Gammaproteobacteria bacterium]MDH4316000.1 AraC family transcriptional regulator [Gammaproteobacteria bacterium]MDH5214863.1 AraC family transcriptional regulator [Gammaproteobacteria bacterium]
MFYGDEFWVEIDGVFDPEEMSAALLGAMFKKARRLTKFASTPDHNFIYDLGKGGFEGLSCYRINRDCVIEIDDTILRKSIVIRNQVADLISFQFVSTVKRSEFLGKRKNTHDLGPALIVSAVPKKETTYRVPKRDAQIRHVAVHTTLSNLLDRLGESREAYPLWLLEILDGENKKPSQRVFFLEEVHRDSIWSCFHLPVSGTLLGHWMSAKFDELLCIGLQILKNSQNLADRNPLDLDLPYGDKIRRARAILSLEYANPPALPTLAQQLGISETRLKSGFKSMNGITVLQFCINKRIEAARLLLKENRHSISEICDIVGYEDHSAFSRAFRRQVGRSPKEWRRSQGAHRGS